MSAPRPRPVRTNTRPAVPYKPARNTRLLSSSSGSTESLISCVNDRPLSMASDSDTRHADSDDEPLTYKEANVNNNNAGYIKDEHHDIQGKLIKGKENQRAVRVKSDDDGDDAVTAMEIGAWEKWMIEKTETLKKRRTQQKLLQKLTDEQKKQEKLEKKEREERAERQRQEWIEKKNAELKRSEMRKHLREKRKRSEEEQKKKDIELKAQEKYNEWLEQKRKTDSLQHALRIEQQKLKEMQLKEKQDKSDQAFQAWLEKVASRTRPTHQTYAKSDGILTGYFNSAASPTPSYYNPVPWQPVAVPPEVKSKPKKNSRCRVHRNMWTIEN